MKSALLVLVLTVFAAESVLGQQEPVRPTVNVTGTAEVLVVPDQAEVRMTVQTLDMDLQAARSKNDALVQQVFRIAAELEDRAVGRPDRHHFSATRIHGR